MTIDRQRIAAVTVLTELGYQWADGKWLAPVNTHVGPPFQPGAPLPWKGRIMSVLMDPTPDELAGWTHVGQRRTIRGVEFVCERLDREPKEPSA